MNVTEKDRDSVIRRFRRHLPNHVAEAEVERLYDVSTRLLGNLVHYRDGGNYQTDDILMVMTTLGAQGGLQ
jgi:hypothetical protein